MKDYTIIIEKTKTGYSAYVPDLPGCITVGDSKDETLKNIREAIELYLEELTESGKELPSPSTIATVVSV